MPKITENAAGENFFKLTLITKLVILKNRITLGIFVSITKSILAGSFSFKNFQLMSITDSLYRSSDFACALPHGCQLNVDLKVAGTRRVPSALHFWVDG
ncbi:hypothetical protein F4212_11390, partial [Candidatus Poribacteria bacterium]|nr:hypothetical protein [Candidatus Poribacteria bacterium]